MKRDGIDPGGLLYWDGSRLQVATYTPTGGLRSESGATISYNNVIFTKLGSVVGFTFAGDGWDSTDIKFDPRTNKLTAWSNIPYATHSGPVSDGYITTTLHTYDNVKLGLGDICMLAGIRAVDVTTSNYKNTTWRLPTNAENQDLVGDRTSFSFKSGSPGIMTFDTGYSLPALGSRQTNDGSSTEWNAQGCYWSSTPIGSTQGYVIYFTYNNIVPSAAHISYHGYSIRCVPQ